MLAYHHIARAVAGGLPTRCGGTAHRPFQGGFTDVARPSGLVVAVRAAWPRDPRPAGAVGRRPSRAVRAAGDPTPTPAAPPTETTPPRSASS
jgi:hypothetical protein